MSAIKTGDQTDVPCGTDLPFWPSRTLACVEDVEAALDLRALRPKPRAMRCAVLGNLVLAEVTGRRRVHYARDRNYYADPAVRQYNPAAYTYHSMMTAIEDLVSARLVTEARVRPGSINKMRSAIWATTPLAGRLGSLGRLMASEPEPIHLKSPEGLRVAYQSTPTVEAMRADVRAQNAFLRRFTISLDSGDALDDFGILRASRQPLLATTDYMRIFNGTWEHGGRWYGPWWQRTFRRLRPFIMIDGQQTIELDYSCCHPRLLCAWVGLDLPYGDPSFDFYTGPHGADRRDMKTAVNALLNADSRRGAVQAVSDSLRKKGTNAPRHAAEEICADIERRYPKLRQFWGAGVGLRLQNVDSEMCRDVQRRLRAQGIPCLSVHDSFIVPKECRHTLDHAMQLAFSAACNRLKRQPWDDNLVN